MERIDDLQFKNLKIIQDSSGFRFGIDSVLLSDFARDIRFDSKIVDLGTGTGIIGILLTGKVRPRKVIGVELQKEVAEMAVRSVKLNHLENVMEIINCDINELRLENNSFDAVVTNPPYKKLETGIVAKNNKQMISRFETSANLDDWIKISSGLLNNKGSFYMVYRTDRMSELFCILKKYKLEVKKIRFVYSFLNKQSKMVLLKAVKYGGVFLKVESPLIIYNDDGSYTDEILKIYNKL
ncbi:MAG: tRNA1(Val) (adenine(37)-N6)-methyltransferase [Clostridia bacterium]|nr:tRNA1(Val) (adenine(37)-N6)-methyltransferase [Clostridia bacterium]